MASQHSDLRTSIAYATHKIAEEEGQRGGFTVGRDAVAMLSQSVLGWIPIMAADLEKFAQHANRKTISADDVKLVARRSQGALDLLEAKDAALTAERDAKSRSRKKRRIDAAAAAAADEEVEEDLAAAPAPSPSPPPRPPVPRPINVLAELSDDSSSSSSSGKFLLGPSGTIDLT